MSAEAVGTSAERREEVVLGPLHTRAAFIRTPRRQAGLQLAVHPLTDTDYGNHEFVMTDPEGNFWSFGSYRGEPS